MLFKVDENLPIEISELLSGAGHDARTINDQGLQGINDRTLLELCEKERRTLVTLDMDFSDIQTYPPQDHEGIILLRVGRQSKRHVLEVFRRILPLFVKEPIKKRLWVVEENTVRIRGNDE
jgi:predicted nuclease of predicted toxin-antitoxin system